MSQVAVLTGAARGIGAATVDRLVSNGWKVVVPEPGRAGAALSTITLRDTSLSSASCAEKHFILQGHLYCHIMDPRTLRPVEGMLQVTIVDPSATASDALSNVLFVKPPRESIRFLRSLPGDAAFLVSGSVGKPRCYPVHWHDAIASDHCSIEESTKERN